MSVRHQQTGFTLVELLLAMTLFSLTMVIATAGFVGMSRFFNKGLVVKALSESSQAVADDVTRSLQASNIDDQLPLNCTGEGIEECPPGGYGAICLSPATRYLWPIEGVAEKRPGLFKDTGKCNDNVDSSKLRVVVSDQFVAEWLSVTPVSNTSLLRVQGLLRTADPNAFVFPEESDDDATRAAAIRCKTSGLAATLQVCALERFDFIVGPRGREVL